MKRLGIIAAILLACAIWPGPRLDAAPAVATPGKYHSFKVAIYITVNSTKRLADDPAARAREWDRVSRQVHFDKVYLEAYRDGTVRHRRRDRDRQEILREQGHRGRRRHHAGRGGGQGGQFGTFDYEKPDDRAECQRAVELAAQHFDEVILDDFFFYTSKSDADIAAKGKRSWTQYRLDTMRNVARISC